MAQRPSRAQQILRWLDQRTGYRAALRPVLDFPVRGGASWAYTFGAVLTVVLLNQALTGVLLAAVYAPGAQSAWASVAYIQDQVWLGWFIRGMHSAGATLMVVAMLLHSIQVTVYGAYKAPREVNWLTGVVLAGLVMGFALTGYLLPWDQKGYWATQVSLSLVGAVPLVGPALLAVVQGGPASGSVTLTRFYAVHVLVLPALTLLLVVLHVVLFRRHGVTPRWGRTERELSRSADPYWPRQAVYDLCAAAVMVCFMVAWVVRTHGAGLAAPADPASAYDARPEWYFLPLFEALKALPGPLDLIVAALGLLLAVGVLGALPFLDRAMTTDPRARRVPLAVVFGGMAVAVILGVAAQVEDARDPGYQRAAEVAARDAARARELALRGVLPEGGTAVYLNDPLEQGRRVFAEHCASCHRLGDLGPDTRETSAGAEKAGTPKVGKEAEVRGPDLDHWGSRVWLVRFLRDPDGPAFFGGTRIHGMKPVRPADTDDDGVAALADFVVSLAAPPIPTHPATGARLPARPSAGAQLFEEKNCDSCHEIDGKTESEGPNLGGHATAAWVRALLQDPASPLFFGDKNQMPSFATKLDPDELDHVSAFVAAQAEAQADVRPAPAPTWGSVVR